MSNRDSAKQALNDEDPEMRGMAQEELDAILPQLEELEERIKYLLIPKDPEDARDVIFEIRSVTIGDSTNAEIGMKHEFGTSYLPERSFLRMPLKDHLAPRLEAAGITDPDVIKKVLKDGTLIPFMKQIAVVAQDTVLEAFKTGGFGQWAPSDMTNKTVHQTLVETTQLRDSITAVVEK